MPKRWSVGSLNLLRSSAFFIGSFVKILYCFRMNKAHVGLSCALRCHSATWTLRHVPDCPIISWSIVACQLVVWKRCPWLWIEAATDTLAAWPLSLWHCRMCWVVLFIILVTEFTPDVGLGRAWSMLKTNFENLIGESLDASRTHETKRLKSWEAS